MSPTLYRIVTQNRATDAPQADDIYDKNIHLDNYEPGDRAFELLQAHHILPMCQEGQLSRNSAQEGLFFGQSDLL